MRSSRLTSLCPYGFCFVFYLQNIWEIETADGIGKMKDGKGSRRMDTATFFRRHAFIQRLRELSNNPFNRRHYKRTPSN